MQAQQKGMNQAKLARLQQNVRIGGKGTARRKRKTVHKTATGDDKKLQQTLKRLGVTNVPQIEEVNMFKDDGTVLHFTNPKGKQTVHFFFFAVCQSNEKFELFGKSSFRNFVAFEKVA